MAMDARCVYASDVHGHTAAHLAAWKGLDFVINVSPDGSVPTDHHYCASSAAPSLALLRRRRTP